jgi:hypothetical protein
MTRIEALEILDRLMLAGAVAAGKENDAEWQRDWLLEYAALNARKFIGVAVNLKLRLRMLENITA